MTVYLVGAGPGDPGLLTVRGRELLGRCDALVYDRLADPRIVALAPASAERVDAGFGGNRRCRYRIVAGDHHGLDAHAAQLVETLAHVRLHHVLQVNHPEDTVAVDKPKRRSA